MSDPAPDRKLLISSDQAGSRLDVVLARWLEVSRAEARALIQAGQVALDGGTLALREKGRASEAQSELVVTGFRPPDARRVAAPIGSAPEFLASGPGWVAVDKPAGMPVHPLRETQTETVLGFVAVRHPEIHGVGEGGLRSGVVHRLDVDTSGVLLMATEQQTWERLRQAFTEQRIRKVYQAIVHGSFEGERELDLTVRVAQHKPARVRVLERGDPHPDARPISMSVRALQALDDATLVEVVPKTGFLHQIRVALAHEGHLLLGDRHYGALKDKAAPRHMLHAQALQFEEIDLSCEWPADFAACLEALGAPSAT